MLQPKTETFDTPIITKLDIKQPVLNTKQVGSLKDYFTIIKTLGSNEMGTLFEVIENKTHQTRIIRELSKSSSFYANDIFQEMSILSSLDHPNILKVYQIIETSKRYYIVLEHIEGGTLISKIQRTCDEDTISNYIRDILGAINYMHNQGIVHCDLNSDHVLLSCSSSQYIPKLIGFNFSQIVTEMQEFDLKHISYHYASPEMLKGEFDTKTDMWSIGILLYNLLVGKLPFYSKEKVSIIKDIYYGNLDFTNTNFIALSNNAQDLIKNLLVVDPIKRYSAADAVQHNWLKQCKKNFYLTYETVNRLRYFKVNSI